MIKTDLTRFFDALQCLYPPKERDHLQEILVVGAGQCEPCVKLLTLFPNARLTAIDLDETAIAKSRIALVDHADRVRILVGDAANSSELAPGPYDLIIVRHPDVGKRPANWEAVLAAGVARLRVGGMLVATTYSLPEASFIERVMDSLPVAIHSGKPYTFAPVALQGNDRYILVYKRLVDAS